jgi:D-tyrosyl-tRNA(Tyr) deacylase
MRVVTQNVLRAVLTIDGKIIASIAKGLIWFVGFTQGDDWIRVEKMVDKIFMMRCLPDAQGKTNRSLTDEQASLLVIPNFTLYGSIAEGRRPSFIQALQPTEAEPLFNYLKDMLKQRWPQTQFGMFGKDMKIDVLNDGPFTMVHDHEDLL